MASPAEQRMQAILGPLQEKRKAYLSLLKKPRGEVLEFKETEAQVGARKKKTQKRIPTPKDLGFEFPSFEKEPSAGPIQNKRLVATTVLAVYNAVHRCWTLGQLKREVHLPYHALRMNIQEFNSIMGVRITLDRKVQNSTYNPYSVNFTGETPTISYILECALEDPAKPLGKVIAGIIEEGEKKKAALAERRQILISAVNELHEKIVELLPALIEGGVREIEMPKFNMDEGVEAPARLPDYYSRYYVEQERY